MRLFTPQLFVFSLLFVNTAVQAQSAQTPVVLDGHQQRHQFAVGSSSVQLVRINELIPGETYSLVASGIPGQNLCLPEITAQGATEPFTWNADAHELTFKAQAKSMLFQLNYACTWDASASVQQGLSLVCKTCVKKDLQEYMDALSAVIEVTGGIGAEELIKDVLIGGDCFDVTGVTFEGNSAQIGTFSQGITNVGFETGVIMATGAVQVAVGPNDQDNASQGFGNSTPDADLSQLSGSGATFDMANIEFDFTPTQTPVTFEFVFASEEYCEYVGSQFNDAFGFFLSGPGINGPFGGAENIAIIPGGQYVTINNVNHLSNAGLYVNNTGPNGILCGQNPSFIPATNELQFDGFTRKFIAVANVTPCQTYHIKLKICDIGDGIYDSAVFLKSGSFDAGGNAAVEFLVDGEPADETYEDCGDVELHFDRVGGNTNIPLSVQYTIQGTASNGADYTGIPFTVVIPSGQGGVTIPVNIINDLIAEGAESIIIKLNNACSCLNPQEELIILDLPVLDVVPDTVTICGPGVGVIGVNPLSGVEPYTFQWQNGATDQTTTVLANFSSNYRVTVTDACGKTTVETARVIVNPLPTAQLLGPPPQLCPGQSAVLQVNFTGTGPWSFDYTLNGELQPTVTDITDDPYNFVINQPGLYQITAVYDNAGCQGPGQGALLVTESALNLSGVTAGVNCFGQANGSINTTVLGGQGPYNYTWQGPQNINNIPDPINLLAGTYSVTVTDGFGCNNVQTFTVPGPPAIAPTILGVQNVNCSNPNGGSINLDVSGGTPGYTYNWSNSTTAQDPQNLAQGTYTVTITDTKGCTRTTTATVAGDFVQPNAEANVNGVITCATTTLTLDGTGSSTGGNYTYNWTAAPGTIVSGNGTLNPVVSQAGNYTLVVTNTSNGCTKSDVVAVTGNSTPPTASGGPDQTLTCVLINATLDGSGSSQGGDFTYLWTASNGGNIISGENTINPVVSNTGTYTLLVTNNINGCTQTDVVIVNNNLAAPNAVVAQPALITCVSNMVTINGSGSSPANNITYQWNTPNGNILSGQTSSSAVVNEPGQYTLVVTNSQNGCTDSETVSVSQDYAFPLAVANVNEQLDCNTDQVTLDGNGSSIGGVFAFNWTTTGGNFVSGQNSLMPVVNAPGSYTLIVTNTQNGCSSVETVQVNLDLQAPPVSAGPPATLTCINTTLTLGDPNAPNTLGYSWTASSGGNIVSGANTSTPLVNQPGTYNVVVTNSANGCTNTASIVIPQNITPPVATAAPGGEINCTTPALQLNGAGSSAGPSFTYEWSSSTGGGIGAGGNTLTPVVTAAATYTLLVTNTQNGCTATASTTVSSNANLPTAVATPSGIFTCTQQQIVLNGNGSTTGGTIQYTWGTVGGTILNGQGTLQATVGAPGQYTLVVTNTANNCTSSFTVLVDSDLTPPVANAGTNQTLNCTVPSLALNGNGSSQGAGFTYQWTAVNGGNFVSPTNTLNPLVDQPGTYQIQVTNTQNGCTSTATVDVIQDASDPVVVIANPNVLNCNNNQIILDGNGSTSGNNITQSWSGPGVVSGGGSLSALVNLPGTYTLVVTNLDNGCTSDQSVTVVQDIQNPPADAGPDNILNCYNPQLQLGGSGNPAGPTYTFNWNGPGIVAGGNTASPVVNAGGQYDVTVTNTVNGCTAVDAVLLNTNFVNPLANAGPGFELNCNTTSYTLNATGSTGTSFTYNWGTSGGSFVTATDILTPTVNGAGFYFLTVTDMDNGCTATSNVQITQSPDIPIATAGVPDQLTCAITTLNLNGNGSSSGANYVFFWTADSQGNIISGDSSLTPLIDAPGVYTLAVTDTVKNCTSFSSVMISEDVSAPSIDAGASSLITCAQPVVSLQGIVNTNGSFSYQWQASNGGNILNGGNTLTPTVDATGTYTLVVTNLQNGCSSTDDVPVADNLINPNVQINPPSELTCVAVSVTLDASGSSTGNMQYDWTTVGGNYLDLSDPLAPVVDAPGMYQVLITDLDNGCTSTAAVNVAENIVYPVAVAGADGLLTCSITSLVLDGTNSSQNGDYFYQWTTSDGLVLTGANSLQPTIVAGGTYTLVVVNNTNGCTSSDQAKVNVDVQPPVVDIATPDEISCTLPQVTLLGASTPAAGVSYSWSTVTGNIVSGQNSGQAVVNAIGEYVFSVLNNLNGCTNETTVTVTENIVLPTAEAGPPSTLTCSIEKITLQGVGSTGTIYAYSWSTNGGNIVSGNTSLNPIVNEAGLYSLTVTNTNTGCTQTDEVVIYRETNVPTDFEFQLDPPTCKDNDGLISFGAITGGIGPYLYSVDNGENYYPELDFASIAPGTYDLWIQDINGCEVQQELIVPQAPDPGIELIPDVQIDLGDSLQLKATLPPGYPYSLIDTVIWTPMTGLTFKSNSILDLLRPGCKPFTHTEYTVTIISVDGCEATDRVLIRVDNEPHIYIPNAFSPWDANGDNDVVYIFADGDQVVQINKFLIFDRWGEKVFEAQNFQPNDPDYGWDGRLRGSMMNPAVFVYYAEVLMIDGRTILFKGDITLVR